MIRKQVYLNTTNPETFIKVKSNDKILVNVSKDSFIDFYINSFYIRYFKSENEEQQLNMTIENDGHIRLYVNPETYKNQEFSIFINDLEYRIIYKPVVNNESGSKYSNSNTINNDRSSFMLLRTNPKLTGNIKLVVDSKDNMYLDTFKVSPNLSDKRYRHALISGKSYFSNDVKNIFSQLPKSDLYKIPEDAYDLFSSKKELHMQYNDLYSYGVKNNDDKLYTENFALLAPLYINDVLPDFFVIFRVDGPISEISDMNSTDRMNYFLKNGKLIKSFDLRKNTPIGNYLINAQSEFQNYPSSVYISCDDYNYNNWIGISVDDGVISQINETTYRLSKIKNQVELDNYITNGFERNGLINSRIINFEFMFNDDDETVKDFSINRYFGLYIKNNEYKKIFVVNSVNNNENSLISSEILDENYNVISDVNNNVATLDEILNTSRIFNITTDVSISNTCYRFNSDPLVILDEQYKNIPYKNILTTPVVEEVISSENSTLNTQFITITINEPLTPGEHLRIIDNNMYDNSDNRISEYQHSSEVFEVIAGKVSSNYNSADEFFDINNEEIINYKDLYESNILNDESIKYLSELDEDGNIIGKNQALCNKESIKIHRNIFAGYSPLENVFGTDDKNEIIKIQIGQIVKSFNSLSNKTFVISNYDNNSISFMANDAVNFLRFERISAEVIHKNENTNILYDEDFRNKDIKKLTYFNNFEIPGTLLSMYNKVTIEDAALLPTDFEVWSNRIAYIINFAKTDAGIELNAGRINAGYIYNIPIKHYSDIEKISLIKNVKDEYIKINDFDIRYYSFEKIGNTDDSSLISYRYDNDLTNVVKSYKSSDMYMISTDMKAYIHNNEINIYSIAPVHLNIAGIMPIKDFNFNVLDKSNNIGSDSLNKKINGKDEYDEGYNDSNYIYYIVKPDEIINLSSDKKYKIISGIAKNINTNEEYDSKSELPIDDYVLKNIKPNILKIGLDLENSNNEYTIDSVRNNASDENILNYFDLNASNDPFISGNMDMKVKNIYDNKSKSDLSLTIPTNAKWRINGLDVLGNKIKLGFNFNNSLSNNSYNLLDDPKLFGFPIYKSLSNNYNSNYVYNDIMDLTYCNDGKLRSYKNKILYHNGSIDELLYTKNNNKSKYSKLYYNFDLNSLETIIAGKKIRISSNNTTLDVKKYNNYLFTFICSPSSNDSNKLIDIIIDEISNKILCVWYLGINNLSYTYRNNVMYDNIFNVVKDGEKEIIVNDNDNVKFTNYKNIINLSSPLNDVFPYYKINEEFNVKNNSLFICTKNTDLTTYKNDYSYEIINPTYLEDYISGEGYITTTFDYKHVISDDKNFNIMQNIKDVNRNEDKLYSYILGGDVNIDFDINDICNILNDNLTNIYIKTVNSTKKYINNLIKFEFIDYMNLSNTLISKNINVYSGYCDPDFVDMFEFEHNETEDVINYTNKNFISSNTRISNVKDIAQIWINKISNQVDYATMETLDSSGMVSFNPIMTLDLNHNHNITKSPWDINFYKIYERNENVENVKYVNGSQSSISNKNFFGSHGMKLSNNSININSWNYYTVTDTLKEFSQSSDNVDKFEIKINISEELKKYILRNKDFISNWMIIPEYIKSNNLENLAIAYATKYLEDNLLKNNYIINNKNNINIYRKTIGTYLTDKHQILTSFDKNDNFEKITNINSKLVNENNNIFLVLEVPNILKYQYAIEYILNRN